MHLEELNLLILNCKTPQFFQKILAHELTLKCPSHELKKINQTIRAFEISLPPVAEKQAIVERMDKLMVMIDDLEKQVSERKEQSEMLMQSVLREAFAKDD
ncbi:MAG: restriction endonuclease subunit S [Candidatus Brocadiales bacterium]|nr:restriction endonuclease subunit S [Candidatus Brocadiales bacterium]